MKNTMNYLIVAAITLLTAGTAFADDTFHSRIRLHGSTAYNGAGVSGVLEMPDLPGSFGETLGLVGVGLDNERFNVGLHVGSLMLGGKADAVVDVRGSFATVDNVFNWGNVRLVDATNLDESTLYTFFMLDYILPFDAPLAVGLETENVVVVNNGNAKDFSVGPNLLARLSDRSRFEVAYQIHSNDRIDNQLWLRLDVKL